MRPVAGQVARVVSFVLTFVVVASAIAQDEPPAVGGEPTPEPVEAVEEAPPQGQRAVVAEAAGAVEAAGPDLQLAFERLGVRDWEGCVAPFRRAALTLEPHPLLGGLRDQCLYNVACALARTDRPAEAVEAFAESVANGLRPVASPSPDGRVVIGPGLSFAHILVDSDLDSLRERDDFRAVLGGLLRAGEPRVEATSAAVDAVGPLPKRLPGVVIVLEEDRDVEAGAQPWRTALDDVPAIVAYVAGPVRPSARARRWLLVDGDDTFAIAKIDEALDALRADERVDPARVHVAALSSGGGQAALSAALARPADIAGLALGPFRFHAAWHADALHDLAARRGDAGPWTVSFASTTDDFETALTAAGATVDRRALPPPIIAPAARGAALRETLLDGLRQMLR